MVTFGLELLLNTVTPDAANSVMDILTPVFEPITDTDVLIGPITLRGGDKQNPTVAESFPEKSTAGARTTASIAPQVCVLAHLLTGRGGRRNQGRLFWPWLLSQAEVDESGAVIASRLTTLQNAFDQFVINVNGSGFGLVVLHSQGKTDVPAPTPVQGIRVDHLSSVQRRRLNR